MDTSRFHNAKDPSKNNPAAPVDEESKREIHQHKDDDDNGGVTAQLAPHIIITPG